MVHGFFLTVNSRYSTPQFLKQKFGRIIEFGGLSINPCAAFSLNACSIN
jgi:hypothetical protein